VTRVVVLVVAALFIVGFAFLTLQGLVDHGLTFEGVVSALVIVLLSVGIFGALLDRRG
jgi:hypothetical protein